MNYIEHYPSHTTNPLEPPYIHDHIPEHKNHQALSTHPPPPPQPHKPDKHLWHVSLATPFPTFPTFLSFLGPLLFPWPLSVGVLIYNRTVY